MRALSGLNVLVVACDALRKRITLIISQMGEELWPISEVCLLPSHN